MAVERQMDAYKAIVPEIKWEANPVKPREVVSARRVHTYSSI